jgi:glutaminyl-tRNA synthetase
LAPNHPLKPEAGKRAMPFGRELWIEREDFMEQPSKGYHRLYPGNMARLRYGYVVKCTGCDTTQRCVSAVHCEYLPDSKSGTPGADGYKVKGNLHWVSVAEACLAEVRLYDRLFAVPSPGARREGDPEGVERDFPRRHQSGQHARHPGLARALAEECGRAEERFQFERHGYFVADRVDSQPGAPVFNRTVTLRDSWSTR